MILRGGIAVGKGWEVERNCLCGSVISEAYNLESKVSNWGRITVSEVLLTRLNAFCDLARECNGWWVLALLHPLLQIINKDIDGVLFLDYLNPAVSELCKREHFGSDWFEECCEKGYKYIINQAEYYQTNANKDYEYSIYSSCCNTERGIYYYKTYENSRIVAVDMHRSNLDGECLVSFPLQKEWDVCTLI